MQRQFRYNAWSSTSAPVHLTGLVTAEDEHAARREATAALARRLRNGPLRNLTVTEFEILLQVRTERLSVVRFSAPSGDVRFVKIAEEGYDWAHEGYKGDTSKCLGHLDLKQLTDNHRHFVDEYGLISLPHKDFEEAYRQLLAP